jgi:hypothetical protein
MICLPHWSNSSHILPKKKKIPLYFSKQIYGNKPFLTINVVLDIKTPMPCDGEKLPRPDLNLQSLDWQALTLPRGTNQ